MGRAARGDLVGHLAAVQLRCSRAGSGQADANDFAALLAEVQSLAECIDCARHDLAALGADEIVARHVPAAADELDAVVTHTAAATGTILDVCEWLEQAVEDTPSHAVVSSAAARIYEACSFQDITGQRVAKVVQTLQLVEARVKAILLVFGRDEPFEVASAGPGPLLNGPQRPRDAMDQTAIDALLANLE